MANLSLRHINKIYDNKVQAVFDFNLEIQDKEFIVLQVWKISQMVNCISTINW